MSKRKLKKVEETMNAVARELGSPATASTPEQQELEALRIKTFTSAIRTKVLVAFGTCDGKSGVSVKQLSQKLNMPHGTVFYHVKQLQKAGFIQEAGVREVNGILERFYKPVEQLVRISPEVAAREDIPIDIYFEALYQQTRKSVGRRSLVSAEIFVSEQERSEFLERYMKLCAEYEKPAEGKMHLAAISITYEVREDPESAPCPDDKKSARPQGAEAGT